MHSRKSRAVQKRVLRLPEVKARTALGTDSIYRGAREGWFPKPIKLSERASGWIESEIDAYLEARIAERDRAAPAAP
jgi:prophage regulatory protein